MFFKNYFNSIADCLESSLNGILRVDQHKGDKGELCEIFLKEFLHDFFDDCFKIFRGGKIINIDNDESKQIDIVLCGKNTIKIFGDKGIYPIETVYGVFSITAKLDHPKLLSCIEEFRSIPKENPKMRFFGQLDTSENREKWKERFPYKCIFGYKGDINYEWENELNSIVENDPKQLSILPDIIVVNKKGMIIKVLNSNAKYADGGVVEKRFVYTEFSKINGYNGAFFNHILNDLYVLSGWQTFINPEYHEYFNKDISPENI